MSFLRETCRVLNRFGSNFEACALLSGRNASTLWTNPGHRRGEVESLRASSAILKCRYGTSHPHLSSSKKEDKKLFTPGPLLTSRTVKEAMLRDLGSRDTEFIQVVKDIREKVLEISGVSKKDFAMVPIQGSGTYAIESVFQTAVPRESPRVLILENGAYGKRMGKICQVLSIPAHLESFPEDRPVDLNRVREIVKGDKSFNLVAVVQCETSSGVFNEVEELGQIVKNSIPDCSYLVDAMSSFGVVPLDFEAGCVDYMVTSANKCLQGVPGFSFVVARLSKFLKCKGNARSLCLDILDQYEALEATNQFRFTPPTHTMLAFRQALQEFQDLGGLKGRADRYKENNHIVREGMKKLGFELLLQEKDCGYVITSFKFPKDPNFNFTEFYNRLNDMDQVIYPGKVITDCFRIGNIGELYPEDMKKLLRCVEKVCKDMKLKL